MKEIDSYVYGDKIGNFTFVRHTSYGCKRRADLICNSCGNLKNLQLDNIRNNANGVCRDCSDKKKLLSEDIVNKINNLAGKGIRDTEIAELLGLNISVVIKYSTKYWNDKMKNKTE